MLPELLELDELLLEELDEDELLDELELLLDDELLELDELEAETIEPAEAVRVTLSNLAPSSRLEIRNVWLPADRLLKVAGVMVP